MLSQCRRCWTNIDSTVFYGVIVVQIYFQQNERLNGNAGLVLVRKVYRTYKQKIAFSFTKHCYFVLNIPKYYQCRLCLLRPKCSSESN